MAGGYLEGGQNAFGALQDQERKTAAYNALNAAYGPAVAYDPAQASNAATAAAQIPLAPQAAQANLANTQAEAPLKQAQTAQSQANTTNLTQSNNAVAGIRGARMLQAIANPDGSIPQDEATHVLSNPAYGLDQNQISTLATRMSQPNGKVALDDIVTALQSGGKATGGLQTFVDENGQTHIIRGTSTGGIVDNTVGNMKNASLLNAATAKAREGVYAADDPRRVAIAQQNANTNVYSAGARANNTAYGAAPGTTLPGQGGNTLPKPSTDLIGAGNPPGSQTQIQAPALTGKPLATRTGQAQVISNADTNFSTANQVIAQLNQQASAYTTGAGSWGDWLRGSQAADLRANAAALRGQVGNAIISSMKNAQGQLGFRMTQQEFKTLTDSLGALGTEQSADQFKQHLGYVQNALRNFNQTMHAGFRTQWGTDPNTALGISSPQGGAPSGWKVLR